MYGRNLSQVEGYDPSSKSTLQQHMTMSGNRHSGSHGKDRESRKAESFHKSKQTHNSKSSTNHVTKSSDRSKHQKVQGGLRSCGNWSEHVSSSGKTYYYNKVSEKSQWEKPDEWNESEAVDLKPRDKSKSSSDKGQVKSSRSSSHLQSSSSKNQSSGHSNSEIDKDYRSSRNKDFCDRDYRTKVSSSADRDYRGDIDYRDVANLRAEQKDSARRQTTNTDKDYRSHAANTATAASRTQPAAALNHAATTVGSNGQVLGTAKTEAYVPSTGEYYDYSNWDGSKPPPLIEVNGTPHSLDNVQLSQNSVDSEKVVTNDEHSNSSAKYSESATTAFVRTLSNVLSSSSSNETKGNLENALQLLLNAAKSKTTAQPEDNNSLSNGDSTGQPPSKRLCTEESRGTSVDQQPMEINDLETTSSVKTMVPEFYQLNALQQVFDPETLAHVKNWPTEHCEKQCQRLAEDYHRFMAEHVLDLNSQLKQARSQVRTAEILSTLQEQRILYIRQQMKDLDRVTTTAPFT